MHENPMVEGSMAHESLPQHARKARTRLGKMLHQVGASARHFFEREIVSRSLLLLSTLTLLCVIAGYLSVWLPGNWEMLTDPRLQNSDARTSIFPFHRYDSDPALVGDPIADEMLELVPIGVHALYRLIVPLTDVFVAPKMIQAIALAILLWAAFLLAQSKRTGIAAGCLLLFLVLHDWFAIYRIAGGLPRAFGFPLFALWLAGALTGKRWARWIAPVLCALTYPSVMNMLLAAEGLYCLRGAHRVPAGITLGRLKRYVLLVSVCLIAVLPAVTGSEERGPIHTLEQAKEEPAFGRTGRLGILPFADPTEAMGNAFVDQLKPRGEPLLAPVGAFYEQDAEMYALVLLGGICLLALFGVSPPPWLALSFLVGSTILYALSRALAFQLYSPERYYSFGMRMAAICLMAVVLVQSFAFLRGHYRTILRNFVVAGFMVLVWSSSGSGVVRLVGMTIDQRRDAALYEFIARLPKDVRFATHPMDGDGIPYYSARATMGSYETLQPWFTGSWKRQRQRTEETLEALYATQKKNILEYAEKYGVTHFLLNERRYGRRFKRKSRSFQPFTRYARRLLRGKKEKELFFDKPPKDAVIYDRGAWKIVDVSQLDH